MGRKNREQVTRRTVLVHADSFQKCLVCSEPAVTGVAVQLISAETVKIVTNKSKPRIVMSLCAEHKRKLKEQLVAGTHWSSSKN